VWGLRVGFVTYASKGISEAAYRALESKTAGVVRGSISNVSNLSQSLILDALGSPTFEREKQAKYDILKSRFEKVKEVLNERHLHGTSYPFTPLPYNSGYFMCIELPPALNAENVRQRLLQKGVGVIAVNNLLRIAYSSVAQTDIKQLFENIKNACNDAS
jgi:aspartate/tyrosine/aromatic aminotransferase